MKKILYILQQSGGFIRIYPDFLVQFKYTF